MSARIRLVAAADERHAHPCDALPFVVPVTGNRNFWAPRPTGDYFFDCELGAIYAQAAMPFLREPDSDLLGLIVLAILQNGDHARDRATIIGMFGAIGRALAGAATTPPGRSGV